MKGRRDSRDIYNERLKLVSSTVQNLAIALTLVIVGVGWNDGFQPFLALWVLIAISLYAGAYVILGNLEEYDDE